MSNASQEERQPSVEERILIELRRMNKVLVLANGQRLESELEKYASTNERKKAWALIDGNRDVAQLIEASGLKRRSLYDFLDVLERASLIERSRGRPPSRTVDYVPVSWAELLESTTFSDTEDAVAATANSPENSGDAVNG